MTDIRKKLIVILCASLSVVVLFVVYYKNYSDLGFKEMKKGANSEQYFGGALDERKFSFWINGNGNQNNIFYTPRGRDIEIRLSYRTDGLPVDPSRIDLKIKNADGKNELLPINFSKPYSSGYEYTAAYTADYIGSDNIELIIKDSPIKYTGQINFYDNSFATESDIGIEDVNFDADKLFSIENKSVESPKFIDDFYENPLSGPETPGKVLFSFTPISKKEVAKKATLDVYTITPSVEEFYNSKFISDYQPAYLSNLKKLENILREGRQNISIEMVPDFPPRNASRGGTFGIKIIEFKGGKGIRFLVPGYFQDFWHAKHPTYIFQGITDDRKHHIVFRYNDVFSPSLEKELKNDPGIKDAKWKDWTSKTFEIVKSEKEASFSPNLNYLDSFIKSIQIK